MNTLKIQIDSLIPWTVKIVRKGERYGLRNCLVHDQDEPLVEFYDGRYAGKEGFDPEGQFVERYYRSTLLQRSPFHGLNLDGCIPDWTVPPLMMRFILGWLRDTALEDVTF